MFQKIGLYHIIFYYICIMRANLKFVKEKYNYFNETIFDGKLPEVTLRVTQSIRQLGVLRHPRVKPKGAHSPSHCMMGISCRMDMEQSQIEDTLIHEMIHLYIYYYELPDTSAHGPIFRRMMNEINSRHGRHLTISHQSTPAEQASDTRMKHHYILLATLQDGEQCICVSARSRIFEIHKAAQSIPSIKKLEWFWSPEPFFNKYPNSLTAKFYKITPEDVATHVLTSMRCQCDGKIFKPV